MKKLPQSKEEVARMNKIPQKSINGSIGKAIKNDIAFDIIGFTDKNELYIDFIDGGRSVLFNEFDKIIWFDNYEQNSK